MTAYESSAIRGGHSFKLCEPSDAPASGRQRGSANWLQAMSGRPGVGGRNGCPDDLSLEDNCGSYGMFR